MDSIMPGVRPGTSTRSMGAVATAAAALPRSTLARGSAVVAVSDNELIPASSSGKNNLAGFLQAADGAHDGALGLAHRAHAHRAEDVDLVGQVGRRPLRHVRH